MVQIPSGSSAGLWVHDQKLTNLRIDLVFSPALVQSPGTLRGTLREALINYEALKAQFAINGYYRLATRETLRQVNGSQSVDNLEKTETISTILAPVFFIDPNGWPACRMDLGYNGRV